MSGTAAAIVLVLVIIVIGGIATVCIVKKCQKPEIEIDTSPNRKNEERVETDERIKNIANEMDSSDKRRSDKYMNEL
jgi:hypothetical protein